MFVLGAVGGSFLCCQVRRMHLKEEEHKRAKKSKARRMKCDSLGARSVCMDCRYQLKWHDNIPIISWLVLRGRCRKCGKKIGVLEVLSELLVAVAMLMISTTIDPLTAGGLEWGIFAATVVLTFTLGFLAIYDGAYGELPSLWLTFAVFCGILVVTLKGWAGYFGGWPGVVLEPLGAVAILGGVYLLLYIVSRGKWVGDGDWLLGIAIGLALGKPWLALVTLFLANLLACIVMFPALRKRRSRKIYFGPFMVAGFVIVECLSGVLMGLVTF